MLRTQQKLRSGFTLVEMLIAMTVTLLIMGALAQAFSVIGNRIRETTVEVGLSTKLRGVAMQLRNDLEYRTVQDITFNRSQAAGYLVYYEGPVADGTASITSGRADLSKWGDFDDYLAFTAQAPPGAYFTGSIPRFMIDASGSDTTPVTIRSTHAEIIYWIGPTYTESAGVFSVDTIPPLPDSGSLPTTVAVPNRLQLHRRVLLIRPDLNLPASGALNLPAGYGPSDWASNWLTGLANVHQICDLSISRTLDSTGTPTSTVKANSLRDLSRPENRFAHGRKPLPGATSLPLLAVGNSSLLTVAETLQGWLLPDFELGVNLAFQVPQAAAGGMPAGWGGDRRGEDVVLDDALAFDIKLFDRNAALVMLPGDDNAAGNGGTAYTEMGESFSDDVLLSPSDGGYLYLFYSPSGTGDSAVTVRSALNHSSSEPANDPLLITRGAFVDLGYASLRGGNIRARNGLSGANARHNAYRVSESEFSGIVFDENSGTLKQLDSLRLSGKYANGGWFQPAFDTWSSEYSEGSPFQFGTNREVIWPFLTDSSVPIFGELDATDSVGSSTGARPPFGSKPAAIQVSIRVEDKRSRQIRQLTVSEDL